MPKYFFAVNEQRCGPLTLEKLQSLNLPDDTLVWRKGLDEWVMVKDLPELAETQTANIRLASPPETIASEEPDDDDSPKEENSRIPRAPASSATASIEEDESGQETGSQRPPTPLGENLVLFYAKWVKPIWWMLFHLGFIRFQPNDPTWYQEGVDYIWAFVSFGVMLFIGLGAAEFAAGHRVGARRLLTGITFNLILGPLMTLLVIITAAVAPNAPVDSTGIVVWIALLFSLSIFAIEISIFFWLRRHRQRLNAELDPAPISLGQAFPKSSNLRRYALAILIFGLFLLFGGLVGFVRNCAAGGSVASTENSVSNTSSGSGLRSDQLSLASPIVQGSWTSSHVGLPDSQQAWSGSCCVVANPNGKLYLVTNAHCLDLKGLNESVYISLVVSQYSLSVTFPSGQIKPVLRFALNAGGVDLAVLEVDPSGLAEGVDYVLLPYAGDAQVINPGDEVVTVGTPLGMYQGTQTFGHVSALRTGGQGASATDFIQMDASISHGNSGGPLLLKKPDGSFVWIGINTLEDSDGHGLYFSIKAKDYEKGQYLWYDDSNSGAANAVHDFYGTIASVPAQ